METIINSVISNLSELVIVAISAVFSVILIPWVKNTAIPWLKEKRIYSIVEKFVNAAEKLASSGAIEKATKKEYVIKLLEAKGITVTDEIDAYIEAAVQQLDTALGEGLAALADAFTEESAEGETESATESAQTDASATEDTSEDTQATAATTESVTTG